MMQAVLKYLRGAAVGAEISIEFEGDEISLDIPREGTVEAGWAIKLVTPPVVRINSFVDMSSFDNIFCTKCVKTGRTSVH